MVMFAPAVCVALFPGAVITDRSRGWTVAIGRVDRDDTSPVQRHMMSPVGAALLTVRRKPLMRMVLGMVLAEPWIQEVVSMIVAKLVTGPRFPAGTVMVGLAARVTRGAPGSRVHVCVAPALIAPAKFSIMVILATDWFCTPANTAGLPSAKFVVGSRVGDGPRSLGP
jgi:hypothetical protein